MGSAYKEAEEGLYEEADVPMSERVFEMLLLEPRKAKFDGKHKTVKDVLKEDKNAEVLRVSLRTQIIKDPTRPFGAAPRILQFFAENPNVDELVKGEKAGVIYEVDGDAETALYFLTPAEVFELGHGNGFAAMLNVAVAV